MKDTIRQKANFFIFIVASIAALGGFVLGFDAGVIVDGKDQITSEFLLSNFQWSIITSISVLGALIAVPISGRFTDRFGTKTMLLITSIGFLTGLTLTATAYNLFQLITGRFLIGICIGIASFSAPLFISEIAPPSIRGSMVLLNGVAITAGQTLSFLASYFLHDISSFSWRIILCIEILPALALFIGMLFMPKSPRWVAKNNGIESARKILIKIRGKNYPFLEKELSEIHQNIFHAVSRTGFKNLFSKKMAPVLMVGMGLGILQQFVGISAIMYYGPVIFESVGFHSIKNAIFATFFIGLINLIFTIVSAFLVDHVGRRFLLLTGSLIAAISMLLISISSLGWFNEKWGIFFMASYMIGYCIGLGSLFWVVIAEIYPLHIRGSAMSVVTSVQCTANFIVTITFLQVFNRLGNSETFLLFGMMCLTAFVFVYFYVPETKRVPLELIEENLNKGKKTRYLGQRADDPRYETIY